MQKVNCRIQLKPFRVQLKIGTSKIFCTHDDNIGGKDSHKNVQENYDWKER